MLNTSQTKLDRDTFTIRFERIFDSPAEDVFDAWTQPEQVSHWWDPSGARLVKCEIDLRPGGAFAFVNDGHSPPFAGTYREISRPSKLVFDALGAVGTVMLEGHRNETRMVVTITCSSAEHFDQFVQHGVADGTARTLDNLGTHLSAKKPR